MRLVSQGFTLVELVVVIALTGIMLAVATPKFANGDIFETRGDAGLLSSTLRYAQKTAIAQRRNVYVIHNNASPDTVSLCFDTACNQAVINPETTAAYIFTSSKNVDINSDNPSLGFDSLGRAVPNSTVSYQAINKKNNAQSVTVTVEADTGYIH